MARAGGLPCACLLCPYARMPDQGVFREAAMPHLPRVGLLLGDPSGVGPELVAKLLERR